MEAESVLNLFDSNWFFHLGIPEKLPETSISSNDQIQRNQKVISRQTSSLARSKSDELSSFRSRNSCPDSVLSPHRRPILPDIEIPPPEIPKSPQMQKRVVRRHDRRKKWLSKSLSELEFEEVKGFRDLGFVFPEEEEDPSILEIIPGLQKLGHRENEEKKKKRVEEGSRMRERPYLSEAWEFYYDKERILEWSAPAAATNEMEIKDSLISWAHTVASAVR